ncbi:hypothetical protein BCM20_003347 [Clostridium beijerinckii]|nr:hypothetical protein [Clostridium beijerinckii]NYC03392.1 hypothetical protein [Clostridium beijerinckii]
MEKTGLQRICIEEATTKAAIFNDRIKGYEMQ